jgi:hypothetical protein
LYVYDSELYDIAGDLAYRYPADGEGEWIHE